MTPEFSREITLDTIGTTARAVHIEADVEERRKLSARFGWIAIERLDADVRLVTRAGGIDASGRLRASLDQKCVATGDPVPAAVDTDFAVRFVDLAHVSAGDDEVELADGDLDVIEFSGGAVDIGEAVAQTLALSVNPFPRVADADARLRAAGVLGEGESGGAFAGLKSLLKP